MENRKLKKSVIYGIYSLGIIALIGTIYLVESSTARNKFSNKDYSYVSKTIFDEIIPVVSVEERILKPYTASDVKTIKSYYDYKADEKTQQDSIIYYENTYMQSNGVTYGKDEQFEVTSILPGTVTEVKQDELLGNVVTIKHNDNVTGIYQCIKDVVINKGDSVMSGQTIGQSGTCKIEKDGKNQLYFELMVKGETVNPESYYGKTLKEIEG